MSALLAACGPGTAHHDTTPGQPATASDGKGKDDAWVCDDEVSDPRQTTRSHCRRKSDVNADKRATEDVINYSQAQNRTR